MYDAEAKEASLVQVLSSKAVSRYSIKLCSMHVSQITQQYLYCCYPEDPSARLRCLNAAVLMDSWKAERVLGGQQSQAESVRGERRREPGTDAVHVDSDRL